MNDVGWLVDEEDDWSSGERKGNKEKKKMRMVVQLLKGIKQKKEKERTKVSTDRGLLRWSWGDVVGGSFKIHVPVDWWLRWTDLQEEMFESDEWKGLERIEKVEKSWFYFTPVDWPRNLAQIGV